MKQEMIGWQWHQLDHMQIATPAPRYAIFYGLDALSAALPTASEH